MKGLSLLSFVFLRTVKTRDCLPVVFLSLTLFEKIVCQMKREKQFSVLSFLINDAGACVGRS